VLEPLRKIPLFSKLSDADLQRLEGMVKEVRLPAGTTIFSEGEPGDWAYVICTGQVEISKVSGERPVLLALRRDGEVIGEMALLEKAPRMASARAVTDCQLVAIGERQLDDLLAASPTAARAMLHTVAVRLKDTEAMLRQSEKMAQLGLLAGGMAHELNNPAAAALRGAEHLREALERLEAAQAAVQAAGLSDRRLRELAELLRDLRIQAAQPERQTAALTALERADREERVESWLREQGLPDDSERAAQIVCLGYGPAELARLPERFGPDHLAVVLERLLAACDCYLLLAEIKSGAQAISHIVGALRRYIYHDQAPQQDVDLHEGLDNTLVMLRSRLKGAVSVQREYAPGLPRLPAYGSELNQVWTNLIGNAVDAMAGKGRIVLRTRREDGWVVVEVEDDGPGIPEELQPRVFSPFFTTKPVGSGTGLGLNISHNIVRQHGGELSFRSRPGQTVFQARLPLDFDASRRTAVARPEQP
jgi:signal transduction histidine kinase